MSLQIFAQKSDDLPGIVKYFMLDANDVATIQSWDYASASNAPVSWKQAQLQWDEEGSTYVKQGTASVTVNGTPITFTVVYSGTKIVVNRVQLNLAHSATVPVFEIEKLLNEGGIITSYIKCDNLMPQSFGTLAYSINTSGKKEAWLAYTWQCLKGQCSANINIYYEKEKIEKTPCY
ncbi:MAG: hypothetical protein POELPBGB_02428 [Bacteroidia bacterium]|nr:hypothetical protein [Bacteroidia bacterium]